MLGVRLPEPLEQRLEQLAEKTHRPKSFYVKEALQVYLDAYATELETIAKYEEEVRKGTLKTYSIEEILARLKLNKDDLDA